MRVWLGLGSNLGDRLAALQMAIDALALEGVRVDAVSPVYETAPQDLDDQPAFLNAVVRAVTDLDPPRILAAAKRVERASGRDGSGVRYGPRALDVDLLVWEGGAVTSTDPDLVIPHARLAQRRFALVPLADLEPALVLPDGRPIAVLLARLDVASQPVTRTAHPLTPPA